MYLTVSSVAKEPKYKNTFVIYTEHGQNYFSENAVKEQIVSPRPDAIIKAVEVLEAFSTGSIYTDLLLEEYAEDSESTEEPELYILNKRNLTLCSVEFNRAYFNYRVSWFDEAGFEYAVDIEY